MGLDKNVGMTNHIHLIISSNKDPLSGIIRDHKKFTSKQLVYHSFDMTLRNMSNSSAEKWSFDTCKMTITYYDMEGRELLVEAIG